MSFSDFALYVASIKPKVCCLPYALNNLPKKYHSYANLLSKICIWDTPSGKPCKKCPNIKDSKDAKIYIYPLRHQEYVDDEYNPIDEKKVTLYAKEKAVRGDIIQIKNIKEEDIDSYIFDGKNIIKASNRILPKEFKVLDEKDGCRHSLYWGRYFDIVNFNQEQYVNDLINNIKIGDDIIYTEIKCCNQQLRIYALNTDNFKLQKGYNYYVRNEDIISCFKSTLQTSDQFYTQFLKYIDLTNSNNFNILNKLQKSSDDFKGSILYVYLSYKCKTCNNKLNIIENNTYMCNKCHVWMIIDNTFMEETRRRCKYVENNKQCTQFGENLYCDIHMKTVKEQQDKEYAKLVK